LQQREKELIDSIRNNEQITVINKTIIVIQPTVIDGEIVKEPVIIGGEDDGVNPFIVGGIIIFIFFVLFRLV